MPPKSHTETGTAHVSASRERNALDCERQYWWGEGPHKIRPPEKPNLKLGTATHRVAEYWLREGTPPGAWATATAQMLGVAASELDAARALHAKAAPIFAPGVQYWPLPGRVEVESPFAVPIEGCPGEFFTGTMDVWDTRANIIATWSGAERVEMQRRYGTYALPTVGDHKSTKSEQYVKTVDELIVDPQVIDYGMEALRRMPAPGVAFQWVYYLTQGTPQAWPVRFHLPAEYIQNRWVHAQKTHQRMVDLVQITDYRKVPTNEKACKKFGGCAFLDYCFGGKKPPEVSDMDVTKTKAWAKLKQDGAASINPPLQPVAPTSSPAAQIPVANPAQKNNIFAKPTSAPVSATQPAMVTQPTASVTVTPPPTPAPAVQLPPPQVIPKATPAPKSKAPQPAPTTGFVLLVDAAADKTAFQPDYVTELFAEPMRQVAEAFGQPNWRYIEFGKGKAALAKAVDDWLDLNPYNGILRLDTGTDEGNALLPVLFPRASLVVRGVK